MNDEFNNNNNDMNNFNDNMNNNINEMNNEVNNNMNEMNNTMNENMYGNMQNNEPTYPTQFQQYPPKKSKAGLIIGIVIALVLVAAGLLVYFLVIKGDKQELSCTMSQSYGGFTLSADVNMKFKDGYFSGGTMSEKIDGSSLTDAQIDQLKQTDLCSSVTASGNEAVSFTNCKQNINGKDIVVSVDLKPGAQATEKVEVSDGKEMFESQGFTCKIK